MLPLSVVILTLNEEKNIERCLRPLLKLSNDILVIDTGSTDQTRFLAKKMGVKVLESEWYGYAETKNRAHQLTRYAWILSLDADEVIDDILCTHIQQIFTAAQPDEKTAYMLKRVMVYCGSVLQYGALANEYRIRLFNKKNARWNRNTVHENIEFTEIVKVEKLRGALWHYSYENLIAHEERIEQYAQLYAKAKKERQQYSTPLQKYVSAAFGLLKNYVFRFGFLDGAKGWQYAKTEMKYTFRKHALAEKALTDF